MEFTVLRHHSTNISIFCLVVRPSIVSKLQAKKINLNGKVDVLDR